jgi:NADH-quinone oxidoreductase subunit F
MAEMGTDIAEIDRLVESVGRRQEDLVPILQALHEEFHYLPPDALQRIPEITDITPASVAGVATFYGQFRLQPAGQHTVKVCIGTACHVKGAETVFDAFKRHLNIAEDEDTDVDRLFTVEKVACLGCCMLAPAVQIDDITYGYVEPGKAGNVLRDFLESKRVAFEEGGEDIRAGREAEVRICLCSSCVAGGSAAVADSLRSEIRALGLAARVHEVGCTGMSYQTPLLELVLPDGRCFRYGRVEPADVRSILLRHLRPVKGSQRVTAMLVSLLEKVLTDDTWEPVTRYAVDLRDGPDARYAGRQCRLATEHSGVLDPLDLDAYLAHDGFTALRRVLKQQDPEDTIRQVELSGLRGRGGAGFPTGWKWDAVRKEAATPKYVICNGDEGDPGAFMDRMILESFPFRVIEGVMLAGYAVGAEKGYLYIRHEYPLAVERVTNALRQCEEKGLLGDNVMESGWSFRLKMIQGAGAFVCGEETALMAAIEGRRGTPRYRPPYPAHSGLWGQPTLVNNVETLALVPWVVRHGPADFAKMGTDSSKGTKAFALAGKIWHGGLIEVPMGITLRQVVEEIGGGIADDKMLKAIQVGGPSGGCVPARFADTPIDYLDLVSVGAIMGSGGLVVLDETDCMVDIARYFLSFTQLESCGKCTFCRIGTCRMLEILDRLCSGHGRPNDIEELEHLAEATQKGSLCGLGKTAPNPVLSTLKHFREEYDAHVAGWCPALKCKELIEYRVTDKCIGCTRCAQICPVAAIEMRPYRQHEIDVELCTRCDACRNACPVEAIEIGNRTQKSGDGEQSMFRSKE